MDLHYFWQVMRRNWIFSLLAGSVFFSLVLMIINNLLSDRMVTNEIVFVYLAPIAKV